jgi:hypothetical protein
MGKKIYYREELKDEIFLGTIYEIGLEKRKIIVLSGERNFSQALEEITRANNATITMGGEHLNYQDFKELVDSCYAVFREHGSVLDFI